MSKIAAIDKIVEGLNELQQIEGEHILLVVQPERKKSLDDLLDGLNEGYKEGVSYRVNDKQNILKMDYRGFCRQGTNFFYMSTLR